MAMPGSCHSVGFSKVQRPKTRVKRLLNRSVSSHRRRLYAQMRHWCAHSERRPQAGAALLRVRAVMGRLALLNNPKLVQLLLILILYICVCLQNANAEAKYVDFKTIVMGSNSIKPPYSSKPLENIRGPPIENYYNLKIRADPNDPTGNSDSVVSKNGYKDPVTKNWKGEKYDFGFFKYVTGGLQFGAYANNDNGLSNNYPDLLPGWLYGDMYSATFGEGQKPDDLMVVHNVDGAGGILLDGTVLDLRSSAKKQGDEYYFYPDILFGEKKLRGDTSVLPKFETVSGQSIKLPEMIISKYDETSKENRGARAVYFKGERETKSGLLDVLAMAEHWLSNECNSTNYWCDGADYNTDGKIDMEDFSDMSGLYSPDDYLDIVPWTIED